MDTAMLVMLILCIVYIPIWIWVWRCPEKAAKLHLVKYGPTIMIKTRLGIKTMDKIGKYSRFWLVFGFISKVVSAGLFFVMMYMLIVAVIALPSRLGSGGIGIQYALAIPGFNPMLPLTYGIVALFIAMVVHEMGHGIQSRANNCKVDSTGLLYGVVPLGAFCEPNEEQLSELPRRPQMDIYSAGITVNTFVAAIAIVLMLLLCSGIAVADLDGVDNDESIPGVYSIDEDSPAFMSGIPTSALITGIRDSDGSDYHQVEAAYLDTIVSITTDLPITPLNTYVLRYVLEDGVSRESEPIQMGVLIKSVTKNSPAKEAGLEALTYLYSMTISDTEHVFESVYDFKQFMATTHPGDEVTIKTVTIAHDGEIDPPYEHKQVTLTSSGDIGYLGISVTDSGFTVTTPTQMMENATDPFRDCSSPIDYVKSLLRYLSGPMNGMDPIPNSITWWYDAPAGELTWKTVKMLYWIFWLDILLAISNALPAYPFDGGFLFEGGINWLLEKLGVKDVERRKKLSGSATSSVSTVILIMFFLVILALVI